MKKIVTMVALAPTLLSAPAFAKSAQSSHKTSEQAYPETTTTDYSNFQNQWNDGNW
jgi:hypothetical protein